MGIVKKAKKVSCEEVLYVRVPAELKAQVEAFQQKKATEAGLYISLSVAVRMLLTRALEATKEF